jgi:hypothetical protein
VKVSTEQKLAAFVAKVPESAVALVLNHNGTTVERWTVEQAKLPNAAAAVLEAGNSHVEDLEQAARFDLEWRDAGGSVVATKLVLCEPPPEDEMLGTLAIGSKADMAHGLALAYKHQHVQLKLFVSALGPLFVGYKELLAAYQGENATLRARMLGIAPEAFNAERTPEENENVRLKNVALTKLVDLGPDVAQLGIHAIAKSLGIKLPDVGDGTGGEGERH